MLKGVWRVMFVSLGGLLGYRSYLNGREGEGK